jgi:hypothetical protein
MIIQDIDLVAAPAAALAATLGAMVARQGVVNEITAKFGALRTEQPPKYNIITVSPPEDTRRKEPLSYWAGVWTALRGVPSFIMRE